MTSHQLNWGILSTARINRAIIPPLKASSRNRLVAVASRSLAKAQAYAREWGIPHVYGDYNELLADDQIGAVYIPLPNSLHAEWAIHALEAGKHVLCEKPLAISVEQVDAISKAADRSGLVVAEAFMYRHHPQTRKVKELVTAGEIGALRLIRGAFSFFLDREGDIRMDPQLGGGCLWDVGCYPISYARYLVGAEPREVFGWQQAGSSGVDMSFLGQLRFAGEVYAQFDASFQVPYRGFIEVVGSHGTISIPNPYKPGLAEHIRLTRGDKVEDIPIAGEPLYQGQVEDLADAALAGRPPAISLAESRANVAAIVALLQSAREGRPLKVIL